MASPVADQKTQKVEHNYKDRSHLIEDDRNGESKPANASDRHFPVKLHYMLAELEQDGLDHIVSWQPHGRCFVVHKQEEFVRTILPTWFRQSKFASFQRQLNLYGFKRLTTGRDKNGYYHELFLRGKRFLAHRIPRSKLKGQGARKPTSPETEPNFYLYGYLPMESIVAKGRPAAAAASERDQRLPGSLLHSGLPLEHMLRGAALRPPMLSLPHFPLTANSLQQASSKSLYESLLANSIARNTSPLLLQPPSRQEYSAMLPGHVSNFGLCQNQSLLAAAGLLGATQHRSLSGMLSPELALRIALSSQSSMRGNRGSEDNKKPPGSGWPPK